MTSYFKAYFLCFIFPKLEDFYLSIKWKIGDTHQFVCNRLNPRQKWIKKYIEYYSWCDKVSLIPDFLTGAVINFYEEEVVDGHIDWKSDLAHETFYDELLVWYQYAKYDRKKYQEKADKLLSDEFNVVNGEYDKNEKIGKFDLKIPDFDGKFYECYSEILNEHEKMMNEKEKEFMHWVAKNSDFFWT